METLNRKVLNLLMRTGSTTASEIIAEFGAKNPYRCISELRKNGVRISDRRIFSSNEKVYYIQEKFNKFCKV